MSTSKLSLEHVAGRLLILESKIITEPETMSRDEWIEQRHLRHKYNFLFHAYRYQGRRISYQHLRRHFI